MFLRSYILILLYRPLLVSGTCTSSTYSYGSGLCSTCPVGATYISSTAGCSPAVSPTDTSFYLSGTQSEGFSAFSTINTPNGISHSMNVLGLASSAITFAGGSFLSSAGSALPSSLPTGASAWSITSWVKCPVTTWAPVLRWGNVGSEWGTKLETGALIVKNAGSNPSAFVNSDGTYIVSTVSGGPFWRSPYGVATDSVGNAYIADTYNNAIKKLTRSGSIWTVSTIFSTGLNLPHGVAVNLNGNIFVSDTNNNLIKMLTSNGITWSVESILEGEWVRPMGIAIDSAGNVFVSDRGNNKIKRLTFSLNSWTVSTILGHGLSGPFGQLGIPYSVAVDASGTAVFVADTNDHYIRMMTFSQGSWSPPTTILSGLNYPQGVAVDLFGNVYVSDSGNGLIKKLTPPVSGSSVWGVSTILDSGLDSDLKNPSGISVDSSGNVFVADTSNNKMRILVPFFQGTALPACDSTWHHISLTYSHSQSQPSSFLDGELLSQRQIAITLPARSSSTLSIGNLFTGSLSDLRIYNRALFPFEIEALSQPSHASFPGEHLTLHSLSPGGGTILFTCEAGYSGPLAVLVKSSVDNSYSWTTSPNCIQCIAGTVSQPGETACSLCPPGTYSLDGASICIACPAGKYGNRAGLTSSECSGPCFGCLAGTAYPPHSSSLSCASGGARALPSSLGMRLLPAAHPLNTVGVDLIIAPLESCTAMLSSQICANKQVVVMDGVTRYVIGSSSDLHMEAGEELLCTAA
jgi:streptogramin lyase